MSKLFQIWALGNVTLKNLVMLRILVGYFTKTVVRALLHISFECGSLVVGRLLDGRRQVEIHFDEIKFVHKTSPYRYSVFILFSAYFYSSPTQLWKKYSFLPYQNGQISLKSQLLSFDLSFMFYWSC